MAILFTFLTVLFMAITFALTLHRVTRYFFGIVEQELLHEAGEIDSLLVRTDIPANVAVAILEGMPSLWENTLMDVSVRRADGSVFFESGTLVPELGIEDLSYRRIEALTPDDVRTCRFKNHKHEGRCVAFASGPGGPGGYRIILSIYPRLATKTVSNIRHNLIWILLAALVAMPAVGLVVARRAYRPVQLMVRQANAIGASNLSSRLERPGAGQELDELAFAFNQLFERLEQSFDREREVTTFVAHELRTPLTSLRGHIESILLDDSLPEQHRGALAVALDSADTLADLVNRMLFLARADRGTCEDMKRGKVDLNSLILETCALVFPDEEERRGRLTVDLPEPIALVADHDMIFRLVLNLVDNAKRHTPAGAAIAIQAHRQGESVTLTVADRGAGVGDGDRERIFEKFYSYTCKDAGRARAGTGLGLAICRSIARLHGGDVCCTETPGGGATFIAKISRDDSMSG